MTAQLPSCTANSFALKWQASPGNPSSYTGLAIGSDGSRSTCNTSLTACTIQNLRCGTTYSPAVTTSSSSASCGTIDDTDYKVQSGTSAARTVSEATPRGKLAGESSIVRVSDRFPPRSPSLAPCIGRAACRGRV